MFKNRFEAGKDLAEALHHHKGSDAIVVAVPRGGVENGFALAEELGLPLEVVLAKKLGHPAHGEFAIGAVSLEEVTLDWPKNISEEYLQTETERIRDLLRKRREMYYGGHQPLSLQGRTVIIVDDGIATGNTLMASIKLVRKSKPRWLAVAVPVAPPHTAERFQNSEWVDEFICLATPENFIAVGQFYEQFGQVSDEEVVRLMARANEWGLKEEEITHY